MVMRGFSNFCRRRLSKTKCSFVALVLLTVILWCIRRHEKFKILCASTKNYFAGDIVDFSAWDNVTGFPTTIVPNFVHFIKFENRTLTFSEFVVILAAWCHQQPERLIIHCDCEDLRGIYWDRVRLLRGIELNPIAKPRAVFGKPLSSVYHAADVARLAVLAEYGGIALDLDTYVVRSLDQFRRFEFTLGWPKGEFIGSQILIAHRNARFLQIYRNSYRNYKSFWWYYNAGQLPTRLLEDQPHLVHRVPEAFGVQDVSSLLYDTRWPDWTSYFAIHLLMRHRSYLVKKSPITDFDENNIRTYPFTYGEMARLVVFGTKNIIRPKKDQRLKNWNIEQCQNRTAF